MSEQRTNWAGNVVFGAERYHQPTSVAELQRLVAGSSSIRALGTGHSFNRIADTAHDQVSLADLPAEITPDTEAATVRVAAGLRYGQVATWLHARGLALHNTASLPHISVAGACATGTHGSGDGNGNLATEVAAVEFVTAAGELVQLSRDADGDRFDGAVVSLGSLGVMTALTLDVVPTYQVSQLTYDDLPPGRLEDSFDAIFASGYSVSVFTQWAKPRSYQTWVKSLIDGAPIADLREIGASPADGQRHPIPGISPVNTTEQLGVPGPWHERLPHFRMAFTPSSGDELQSEYLLPREHALAAIAALDDVSALIAPVLLISEIRTVAADQLWLSPSYGRDTVAFHFTWIPDAEAAAPVVAAVEAALLPFDPRPHWGKVFSVPADLVRASYPRWDDFAALLIEYDAAGKFRNEWVERFFPR